MAEVVGRVPETEVWGVELPFHWRNQIWQSSPKGCRKARFGVCTYRSAHGPGPDDLPAELQLWRLPLRLPRSVVQRHVRVGIRLTVEQLHVVHHVLTVRADDWLILHTRRHAAKLSAICHWGRP